MRIAVAFLAAFSLLVNSSCSTLGGSSDNDFKLRPYKQVTLKNGLPVLLIEDKALPYYSLTLLVKTGSSADPAGKSGVARMVGSLLDKGSSKRNALQIADSLGQVGAEVGVGVYKDFTIVSGTSLSMHHATLLKDFSEIVTDPTFSEEEVSRVQKRTLSSLRQMVDNPSGFAQTMFDMYLYGNHPYASRTIGNTNDIKNMRRKDIIRFYLENFRPNNSILAVVGNYNPDTVVSELETAFTSWAPRKKDPVTFPEQPKLEGLQIGLVDKSDLEQTQILLGHVGIKRTNPDFLKLRVANTILGGAFHSRLVEEVREKNGLTYSISSSFDAREDKGPFVISTFTRHEKVGEAVQKTVDVLKTFREKGVTKEEVEEAKAYLKGVFPRALETPERLAENLLILRYYGLPDSYLTDYLSDISKIEVAEVNEVIQKYFYPDQLKVLVYSPKKKVLDQLKKVGQVEVKSYQEFL